MTQSDEETPLLPRAPSSLSETWHTKPVVLLLLMKLFGSAFEYQLMSFNIASYTWTNNTDECRSFSSKLPNNIYCTALVWAAAAAFLLPALGGLISDKYFSCIKVLTWGSMVQFWASILFPLSIVLSVICNSRAWYFLVVAVWTVSLGFVDPLLLYALMKANVNGSQGRRMLVFAYFIAAVGTECLGGLPSLLKYLFGESGDSDNFEFLGILPSAILCIGLFLISSDDRISDRLRSENFEFPRPLRLRRYYVIVSGGIPFLAVILLSRNVFYWHEIKYYTRDDDGFISAAIPMVGYQLATFVFCLLGAVTTVKGTFPKRLTIGARVCSGLTLMLCSKVALFAISFAHSSMSELGQSHPRAVQAIYFVAAFTDGISNALTDVAMYELVDCIAERTAKAMYIGIFYTTWGFGLLLTGIVVVILRTLPSEGYELTPPAGVQPQFYIRYAITVFLLLLSLAYFSKVSLPLAEPLIMMDLEESDDQL